ncbi:hypothetical protein EHV15_17420 [Paenibacillus oralis]|uniref:PLP-dependent aminotransferase family protein n=1 Tax=Paenibacillus oralis TaxID=2490856 RepID=A0A3P3U329_9BACL|nr:hypothetical protein [Paenibacillus oralis]RRJ64504.1 hypothetical protein EHV15_17420 [Paenibacillus oralis]
MKQWRGGVHLKFWLEMLGRSLPPAFVLAAEERLENGTLIGLAGSHGNGVRDLRDEDILNEENIPQDESGDGVPAAGRADRTLVDWLAAAYAKCEGGESLPPQQWLLAESADGALELALRTMVPGGGAVLVETPAAPEALELMRRLGLRAVPVECDRDGMLPDDVRRKARLAGGKPGALAYVTPHFSNPSGRVWSRQRKLELLALSAELELPLVEDDTAGALPFALLLKNPKVPEAPEAREAKDAAEERLTAAGPGDKMPRTVLPGDEIPKAVLLGDEILKAVVPECCESLFRLRRTAGISGAEVIGVGSFERTLLPQLPLAWLRGEAEAMERLRREAGRGSGGDLSAAGRASQRREADRTADDRAVAARAGRLRAWLASPAAARHAAAAAAAYTARRALALELLQAPAWRGACAADPGGGLYLWVSLPAGISSEALLRASLLEGTAFLPGTLCYAGEPDDSFIRLTVAALEEARLREGLARIAAALAGFTARSGS